MGESRSEDVPLRAISLAMAVVTAALFLSDCILLLSALLAGAGWVMPAALAGFCWMGLLGWLRMDEKLVLAGQLGMAFRTAAYTSDLIRDIGVLAAKGSISFRLVGDDCALDAYYYQHQTGCDCFSALYIASHLIFVVCAAIWTFNLRCFHKLLKGQPQPMF